MNHMVCKAEHRREKVRQHRQLNGLDYVDVGPDQKTLTVHLLSKAPLKLDESNIRIEGGRRIRDVNVISVEITAQESAEFDDVIQVVVDKAGDFSTYRLAIVEKDDRGQWRAHSQFDPRYDYIEFSFKVDCPNDLDCKQELACPPQQRDDIDNNYLAKDYASFRQLILDRLALVMPDWQERHVPDMGIALVEVMAYVGDHLSYYQDAVATEAYLDTARKRISIRRHARLVDYAMHEGCNARAWVCIHVSSDLRDIKPDNMIFITGFNEAMQHSSSVLKVEELDKVPASSYEVFEPIIESEVHLYKAHNKIKFYTWGDQLCCIAKGATSATLVGQWVPPSDDDSPCEPDENPIQYSENQKDDNSTADISAADNADLTLNLRIGDILILEEVIGPKTGNPRDANPQHRHAVRLTKVEGDIDPLTGQAITHITWSDEDALPFPLCLSAMSSAPECEVIECVSVACGNVVLVDHGRTVNQDLPDVPQGEVISCCKKEGLAGDSIVTPGLYNPALDYVPLTHGEHFDNDKPASQSLTQNPRQATAKINVASDVGTELEQHWQSRKDLFSSGADDLDFVAEIDNDGRAYLRFGNDEMGRRPEADTSFRAKYRIGNGLDGNVGAEVISHVVFTNTTFSGVDISVRNPIPAQGGVAAEPINEVKLFAPGAFRKQLQRAITADDYAALVLREFSSKVQGAVAKLRWNGSWYEVLVAIDAYGQNQADQILLHEISARLHRYRRIGHDLVVQSAQRVPLDIELKICVSPNYLRGHIKTELLTLFSSMRLNDGRLGFFHADKMSFGKDIYLSELVALAQSVEGVTSVQVCKLQRWCESPNKEIENGLLPLGIFEIARLDNDPNNPENGILTLDMRGGR